jgi:hypothetical protein
MRATAGSDRSRLAPDGRTDGRRVGLSPNLSGLITLLASAPRAVRPRCHPHLADRAGHRDCNRAACSIPFGLRAHTGPARSASTTTAPTSPRQWVLHRDGASTGEQWKPKEIRSRSNGTGSSSGTQTVNGGWARSPSQTRTADPRRRTVTAPKRAELDIRFDRMRVEAGQPPSRSNARVNSTSSVAAAAERAPALTGALHRAARLVGELRSVLGFDLRQQSRLGLFEDGG